MELHLSSASIAQKEATSIIWPMMERGSIQERYFDPQFDGFALPDLDDLFDDDYHLLTFKKIIIKRISTLKPEDQVVIRRSLRTQDVYGGTGSDRLLIDTILSVGKNPYYGVIREGFDAVSVFDRKPQVGITVKEEVDGVKASKCESLSEKRDLGSHKRRS
ncbi:hypothetical protein ACOSQ3_021505 [Xanthoceras sorbifolium]